jgi:hypothetical protein
METDLLKKQIVYLSEVNAALKIQIKELRDENEARYKLWQEDPVMGREIEERVKYLSENAAESQESKVRYDTAIESLIAALTTTK